ncbi:ATP-dependent RNA helicase HrpA [Mycobacterium kiyosense]|uniref:ATP-dependent helicase HrpA n=1 Tax=Mycobacterium kiyosense TaxID=2871094 RepID=A0A9P3Q476_9MYCO|nr:ATP-dependent RNA helicase HrpA [Mycobacterium kiyosense]GLB81467.1 ATP-dependent helicase HrpA [Mycobacterium kiyosense]GLB93660.1 ATP-dependent helicase HrpA [Mycobacterium kiyosense]GLD28432.1 ATP-dependent helicase HrpA [Mycobacterium kiyosense]GLD34421.1 ATP-dependent helicase HrpA [Mycobacterium kiyosense]
MPESSVAELRRRLDELTVRDADRLRRRLRNVRGAGPEKLRQLGEQIADAEALVAARRAAVPVIGYPDLPISERRQDIAEAIAGNQVVIVAGETGSGKTTQLPKICLEVGRGVRGVIGHTQPRRLAARTVAQRIADELGSPLGDVVGYTVRFTDQVSDRTLVKLMTDGILLAEIQRDRRLLRYDTLILDEAHERSLNIDFLLGYLRELLPRRPDLKLIVTSATIEPQRFAAHFGNAPIVEVSGRTYPVEIRYRPLEVPIHTGPLEDEPDDPDHEIVRTETRDEIEAIVDAIGELQAEPPGDVLVFLSGEREIRDTAEALADLENTEVLPLYARLPTADQQKVFAHHTGRRVVLATNVAETSLTVPGIRYVVDPGNARISRYSRRLKVQRLPIEPISQASAAQRAGRCGRVAPGVCIRLYSEQDFSTRPRYTEPEILRTNLAAVLLQMAALQLGDIENFPFLDPPDRRSVRDGVQLLQELGAFDRQGAITDLGRRLARLPVDPRLGRMILQAQTEGCVREVLVLAAALTIPDPRERPVDREEAARQKHARFADEHSDFVAYLNLWQHLREQRKELSGSAFRRMCRNDFLHYLRIREWQDLVGQLRGIARDLGIHESDEPAGQAEIHAALLAGLLSHVGLRREDAREYLGARNARFVLAPGSALGKRPPRWVVVAELVETSRLYGRTAARIQPEMVERIAGDLVQRTYSEPHWDAKRGEVLAYERVTLYGLPLIARRRVGYGGVEPAVARELFIRHALVEGDWHTRHHFFADNARLRAELEELEERARRRDLLVGDDDIYALYDARIPAEVVSARHFDGWWKKQRHRTPDLLTFTREDLLHSSDTGDDDRPDTWRTGDTALPLTYRFEPGADDDGVTVHVPIDVLARLGGDEFAWQVPALREELITALIRSLPKELRRNFVPAPDTARAVLAGIEPSGASLLESVQRELRRRTGILVPIDAFALDKLPPHLRVTFAVESADGSEVARGKNLRALQEQLAAPARAAVAHAVAGVERSGLRQWPDDLTELPRVVERVVAGRSVRGFPAFVDAGNEVDVRVFATEAEQRGAIHPGLRRLLRLSIPSPVKAVERQLDPRTRLTLGSNPDGSVAALLDDCADAATDALVPRPVWTRDEFASLRDRVAQDLAATTVDMVVRVEKVLSAAREVELRLPAEPTAAQAEAIADIRAQLHRLLPPGFVTATGRAHLGDLTRYLTAISRRLDRLPQAIQADRDRMQRVHAVQEAYDRLVQALPPARAGADQVTDIARQIEELRVSLWAQQLGTPRPVSEQRVMRAIDALHGRI